MNKNLGNRGLLIVSFLMSPVLIWFLPVYVNLIVVPVAFIMGVLALMRFSKEKNTKGIIASIIVLTLQIVLLAGLWIIENQVSQDALEINKMETEQWLRESQESEQRIQKLLNEANVKN